MYQTIAGEVPFEDWLLSLKDKRGQAKLHALIVHLLVILEIEKLLKEQKIFLKCVNTQEQGIAYITQS